MVWFFFLKSPYPYLLAHVCVFAWWKTALKLEKRWNTEERILFLPFCCIHKRQLNRTDGAKPKRVIQTLVSQFCWLCAHSLPCTHQWMMQGCAAPCLHWGRGDGWGDQGQMLGGQGSPTGTFRAGLRMPSRGLTGDRTCKAGVQAQHSL